MARPESPTGREELTFHLLAPLAVIAIAQVTDPGTIGDLVALVPVVVGFALRPVVPRFPAELFGLLVAVPVTAVVGRDGDLEGTFFLTVIMVLYTSWTLGSVTRAVVIAAVAALAPWLVASELAPGSGIGWNAWAMAHVFTFVLGRTLQRQRALIAQLEAAREALATQAVADERRRIARELHDLAGHTLAAMVLHVTGARHVMRRDPEEAERALSEAEGVGRASLDQIRATVAALRTDERGTDPALAGSADLPALVDEYRSAGLVVTAHIAPDVAAIGGPVGVALHRIAREALANVARHAPDNRVEVDVRAVADEVLLAVVDCGRRPTMPSPDDVRFGLVGMTERARALGGSLDAGPTSDGWRVDARLPFAPISSERSSSP
ncbi:MAG: histidine kinase [Acidimicrobiales bacterium]